MTLRSNIASGSESPVTAIANASKVPIGIPLSAKVIGPRRDYEDHTGDWARIREISDSGCLLVRPDHHVAWRAFGASKNAQHDLATALKTILEM